MQKITLKTILDKKIIPVRDLMGYLIAVRINNGNYNIKYFSKEAKDYIFSKFPEELSSLEKELL